MFLVILRLNFCICSDNFIVNVIYLCSIQAYLSDIIWGCDMQTPDSNIAYVFIKILKTVKVHLELCLKSHTQKSTLTIRYTNRCHFIKHTFDLVQLLCLDKRSMKCPHRENKKDVSLNFPYDFIRCVRRHTEIVN